MKMCFISMILTMIVIIVCIVKTTNVPKSLKDGTILVKQKRSIQRILSNNVNITTLKRQVQSNSTIIDSKMLSVFEAHKKSIIINNLRDKHLREGHAHSINYSKNMEEHSNGRDMDSKKNMPYTNEKPYESTLIETQNTTYCSFTLVEETSQENKQKLEEFKLQPVFLFYVKLLSENQRFSIRQSTELLHWQFVLWKVKSLISLPVDFDIITFNSITTVLIREKVHYNTSNCIENFSYTSQSLRFLLWDKLFANDTRYYLCHRQLEDDFGRTLLYAITNIWIGYNFNCSTAMTAENETQNDSNYYLTIVIEIFCYTLSLQFVWIFALLDISFKNKQCNKYSSVYYRNERPYSPRQFIYKLLYKKNASCCCQFPLGCIHKPITNIIKGILILNAGLASYRTIFRSEWGSLVSEDHLHVIRPSEWFIYLIYLYTHCSSDLIKFLDIFYAVFFPCGFIWLGRKLHKEYLSDNKNVYPFYFGDNDDDWVLKNNKKLSDRFLYPWYVLRAKRNNCVKAIQLILSCCFPICPFSYNALDVFLRTNRDCGPLNNKYGKCMCRLLVFVSVYALFLRPIISTFTFLFRSFTYVVFVAIPINTDTMRYIVIIITALLYYYKFIHEISNMYAEILEFIFKIMEQKETTLNDNSKTRTDCISVTEERFDAICKKLFFTRKKLYFVFLKMGIISIYLWIALRILDDDQLALSGYDIRDIVEISLAAIGPYAVSFFLKGNNETFLTKNDEDEIQYAYTYKNSADSNKVK